MDKKLKNTSTYNDNADNYNITIDRNQCISK